MITSAQINNEKETKKVNGAIYTPVNFAEYVAEKLIQHYLYRTKKVDKVSVKVIDPACGDGELLIAIQKSLLKNFQGEIEPYLYGVDIDKKALSKAKTRFNLHVPLNKKVKLFPTNSLFPFSNDINIGWNKIKNASKTPGGFDLLIANPPWGANLKSITAGLAKSNFRLKKGQFDSSDLFVELALSIVKKDGYLAFILPDSLFSTCKKDLRAMLLKQTKIKFVGRFGEKIFKNINMACVVIICKNSKPSPSNKVNCFHLTPTLRRKIVSGEMSFSEAELLLAHKVSQLRFKNNKDYLLNIDTKENDKIISHTFNRNYQTIENYFVSSRGVELSKSGKICKCKVCQYWMPIPIVNLSRCNHCKAPFILSEAEVATIISQVKVKGAMPLLVGKSIKRYAISSKFWINTENKGINYKDISIYHQPKILVRKTGVGITATLDYSRSLTNQVVYMFRPKDQTNNSPPIELFLAIINSRAMYYQLSKKYGETEWRSHPYLTQKQVLDLPLPRLDTSVAKSIWEKISTLLNPYLHIGNGIPSLIDAKVERCVAKLYGLSFDDYIQIYNVLNSNQDLLPVRALKQISPRDIFSVS